VKGFGCRQEYESLSCSNPRATVDGYGDFDLRPMSAMVRPTLGSVGIDAERPLRCDFAQSNRSHTRLVVTLWAAILKGTRAGPLPKAVSTEISRMLDRALERSSQLALDGRNEAGLTR